MSQCAQCGAEFKCGMVDAPGDQPCWCAQLPALLGVPLDGSCLCPACLQERLRSAAQGREVPDGL
ncbi:cysteine-rich CWC family protein [Lacisediminimonas profundi]|uniref:cysteine-rich CWC family protein n=1 Tax=Lacisediminimonas profundi TaxID=2603856 RepID=UPI00124B19AB|nr:cysteine-rich CWC family protein [Lacisediminimonas profundi]